MDLPAVRGGKGLGGRSFKRALGDSVPALIRLALNHFLMFLEQLLSLLRQFLGLVDTLAQCFLRLLDLGDLLVRRFAHGHPTGRPTYVGLHGFKFCREDDNRRECPLFSLRTRAAGVAPTRYES